MGVADGRLRTVVPKLLGTHLTALTAICDEADAQRAAGWGRRAHAWPLAELGPRGRVLQWSHGEGHGRGGWREGLRGKWQRSMRAARWGLNAQRACGPLPIFAVFQGFTGRRGLPPSFCLPDPSFLLSETGGPRPGRSEKLSRLLCPQDPPSLPLISCRASCRASCLAFKSGSQPADLLLLSSPLFLFSPLSSRTGLPWVVAGLQPTARGGRLSLLRGRGAMLRAGTSPCRQEAFSFALKVMDPRFTPPPTLSRHPIPVTQPIGSSSSRQL